MKLTSKTKAKTKAIKKEDQLGNFNPYDLYSESNLEYNSHQDEREVLSFLTEGKRQDNSSYWE